VRDAQAPCPWSRSVNWCLDQDETKMYETENDTDKFGLEITSASRT